MADNLTSAQVIGGVVVTIGADTSQLHAAEARAKAVAAAIERVAPTMKVKVQVDQRAVTEAVKTITNTVVEITPRLNMQPAMRQIEDMRRQVALIGSSGSGGPLVSNQPGAGWFMPGASPAWNYGGNMPYGVDPNRTRQTFRVPTGGHGAIPDFPEVPQSSGTGWVWGGSSPRARPSAGSAPRLTGTQYQSWQTWTGGPRGGDPDIEDADWSPIAPKMLPGPGSSSANLPAVIGNGGSAGNTAPGAGPKMWVPVGSAGGGSNWGFAAGRAWGRFTSVPGGTRTIGAMFERAAMPLIALDAAGKMFEAGKNLDLAWDERDPTKRQGFINAGQEAIGQIPVAGNIIRGVGNTVYSGFSALKNLVTTGRLETDYGAAERIQRDTDLQNAATDRRELSYDRLKSSNMAMKAVSREAGFAVTMAQAAPEDMPRLQAQKALDDFDRENQGTARTEDYRNARGALLTSLAQATQQGGAARNYAGNLVSINNGAMLAAAGANLAVANGTMSASAAGRLGIQQGTATQVASLQNELGQLKGSGSQDFGRMHDIQASIDAVKKAGDEALAEYDANLKREAARITTAARAGATGSRQRIAGDLLGATVTGINAAFAPQLDDAVQRFGANSPQVRALLDQRNASIGEAQVADSQQRNQATIQAQGALRSSLLRAGQRNQAADLSDFDASAAAQIGKSFGDKNTTAYQRMVLMASLGAQRGALVSDQGRENQNFGIAMDTRRAAAVAQGSFEPITAQIIQQIGAGRIELNSAQAGQKVQVAQAQIAELQAAQTGLLRPNQYASQGDRLRDAFGGPGGETGKDQIDAAKMIVDAIKELQRLVQNGGTLGN